jgi:hypothetical protein
MAVFFKALAAIVTADAINRNARSRPTKYWYPNQPGLPPTGTRLPYVSLDQASSDRRPGGGWHPERPERPA